MGRVSEPVKGTKEMEPIDSRYILKKIVPAAAGSFIEFYEFAIFGYLSTYITANFWAGHGGSLATWASFAIGLVPRPIGGVVFGWLADNMGRKKALQVTIVLMLVCTLLQGCLPTFYCCGDSWGWFGLASMLILRIAQGLSAGGELATAAVYISEVSPRESLGFNLSWISLTGAFGAWSVASLVVWFMQVVLTDEQMSSWGWRIPYWSSIIPGICIMFGRRYLEETPDFEEMLRERARQKASSNLEQGSGAETTSSAEESPVMELLRKYKLALVVGAFGASPFGVLAFVPPMYGVQFIGGSADDSLPASDVTLSEMVNYLIPALLAPAIGLLIDKWGAGHIFGLSSILGSVLAPAPFLYWIIHAPKAQEVITLYAGQVVMGLCLALTTAVYAWLVELFPVHVRATGVCVTYNVGVGLFGGLGPLISDAGNKVIDPTTFFSAPALYTIFFGIMSCLSIYGSRLLARKGCMEIAHIRDPW
eukprot:TRINITY_DN6353_c0_g1_i2.p1 TRINITY_DN6353_c0_g1~~TRINITY_DN6353_c0_g1_i2.p1  ORF type:complete len:478 (+),score=80.25 TRINITY_DN6353_c0_g1_i2:70-1503(+)